MLRRILIGLGYLVGTALIVGVTAGLVAYGAGWRYDILHHHAYQTGSVIIQSTPAGAYVTQDSKYTGKKTTFRRNSLRPGQYTYKLSKDGYQDWYKTLSVVASQVALAQYVIMIPKHLATQVLDTKPQVIAQSFSKDHRHLAYITGGTDPALYTIDPGSSKPVKLYTPKVATATDPAETLTGVSWSDDASHLLISSSVGPTVTYRLAAAGGGEPVNLTQQYGFDFTGLSFSGNNWHQLYWVSPDGLRRLDVGSQSVSGVLAANVSQFSVAPDRVLYVQSADTGHSMWSIDGNGHKQELIAALVPSSSYSFAYVSYQGQDELAVVPAQTGAGTLYTGVYGPNPAAKTLVQNVANVSFSPDGHLLLFWSAHNAVTYDLTQSRITNQYVLYQFPDSAGDLTSVSWFDNFHLVENRGGRVVWSEFDGQNTADLGPVGVGLAPFGGAEFKNVYAFEPSGQTIKLEQITVKP